MALTPPDQRIHPAHFPQTATSLAKLAAGVTIAALALFALGVTDESFVDEYAYITQSYYADHYFRGDFNHPDWLQFPALDLQPLPKYLIGLHFRAVDLRIPSPTHAYRWYESYATFGGQPAGRTPLTLIVARVPFIALGAIGCAALFGWGVLITGWRVGVLAAALLMINPLYRLHAHRAMSDVAYESLLILALGSGLWAWRRFWAGRFDVTGWLLVVLSGVSAAMSIASKLSGLLSLIVLGSWTALTLLAPRLPAWRKVAIALGAVVTIAVTAVVFTALNPALTAHPSGLLTAESRAVARENAWQRFRRMIDIRRAISDGQKINYPHNALHTAVEKIKVFAVQGFGRFGPFGPSKADSTVRYDLRQDAGILLWAPIVLYGLVKSVRLGRSQLGAGGAPTAFALVIWAVVACVVVAAYLPMAWDRYLLPIQAPSALLAAVALEPLWDPVQRCISGARSRVYAPACWVFVILLASYAFYWHSRDWNTASRLMLTYALVDRGSVAITGLEQQTGDKAYFHGQYYSDKFPGFPLLAALPYAYAKWICGIPDHPLDISALAYWPADYWITLGTSGALTAWTGSLLVLLGRDLGCRAPAAALVGLAYGLSTPAYVYATLAYGHQAAAFALLGSFFLLLRQDRRREGLGIFLAGFLAAYAAVIELQVSPVSALLGVYLVAQCVMRKRAPDRVGIFAVGALVPGLLLLGYNQLAFGSPWEVAYSHHVVEDFARVHTGQNPLGLRAPDWSKLGPLLWGRYRGLLFYAPILILALPGWAVLWIRRQRLIAVVSMLAVAAVLLVNVSYPEWTGGWSTGPRLLVPLIPFAMLPVAGLLAGDSRWARAATLFAGGLALAGGVLMILFQGVGGRIPQYVSDPMVLVWELWSGKGPLPPWWVGERFCCNLVSLATGNWLARLDPARQWVQFLPLILAQAGAILGLWRLGCGARQSANGLMGNAASSTSN
jgi:hypothetical protein